MNSVFLSSSILLFLFLNLPLSSTSSLDSSCSENFTCGDGFAVGFPFWGGDRPEDCGHPALKLNCESNIGPILVIGGVNYLVLKLDVYSKTLRIIRTDFLRGICWPEFHDSTFDPDLFDLVSPNSNSTFSYNCSALGIFSCSDYESVHLGPLGPGVSCGRSVVVYFSLSNDGDIKNITKVEEDVGKGFEVKWKINDENCRNCNGGCGYDSNLYESICYSAPQADGAPSPSSAEEEVKKSRLPLLLGVAAGGAAILCIFLGCIFCVAQRRKKHGMVVKHVSLPHLNNGVSTYSSFLRFHSPVKGSRSVNDFMYSSAEAGGMNNSRRFTYEDLIQATDSFSAKNILGEGGFGCVFKGTLPDGREIAVKQLKLGGGQGEREFRAEVDTISRIHHRHLVSLVGYCISEYQRLLVYDYVPNNTLHYHLHGNSPLPLCWATRGRIAAGTARGIAYLHEDCHPRIIHRDIKSSNILLDTNFEAQVADFGLAKLTLDTHTHVSTRVMGTFGYIAPDYATSGKLTDKSDVFSFGVVLLELITGRKPVDDSQPLGCESLVEWACPRLAQALANENFEELVDARLEKNYVPSEMFRMIEAAAACVHHSAVKRPRMSQVVRALNSLDEMSDLANGVKPGQSGVFDSAQHSAQIRMLQRMAFGSQDWSTYYFNRDRSRSQSSWRSREDDDLSSSPPFNRSRQLSN